MEEVATKKGLKQRVKEFFSDLKVKMNPFKALVLVQLRDKLDLSWTKQRKTRIQQTVFFIVKFVVVIAAIIAALNIVKLLFSIKEEILHFYLLFLGIFVVLNVLTVTIGLVKSLYYAEDNKVLVTYPVSSGKLFLSKILVFQIFEFKKSADLLLPVTLGFLATAFMFGVVPFGTIIWSIIPLILVSIITVLLGALLSIPVLFIYKFLKNNQLVELFLLIIIVAAVVFGLIYLINLIPVNKGDIDINKQFPIIKANIVSFINAFSKYVYPTTFAFETMVGAKGATYSGYRLVGKTFGQFGIMIAVAVALFLIVYFVIKPFFFSMMTRTFEFNKKAMITEKKNKPRNKYVAFVGKELKLVFRDVEISGSYLCVYIFAPILLLFIDRIFMAMDTSFEGNMMAYTINILLMTLPLLASSTIVSTVYSREGRAAYMKKTKPVKPYFPLVSKLLFNLILVIPSIIGCCVVFANFAEVGGYCIFAIFMAVLGLEYGHIFISAALDIMNPQNELYATEGDSISNPNEKRSTFIAFLIAIIFSVISYILFKESNLDTKSYTGAFTKLMIVGIVFGVTMFILLILKIKAFYIDRQEATRE